jgi:hypothetical protein
MHMGDIVFENKVTHIGAMQRDNLTQLLDVIEPLSFGGTSLNALVDKGKREIPKEKLLNIATFCTGLEPHYELTGDERKVNLFGENAKDLSDQRGNRGQSLPLATLSFHRTMNHCLKERSPQKIQ